MLDLGTEPALLEWLARACVDIDIEPVQDVRGFDIGYQVVVHNGVDGEGREEAVIATCDGHGEAQLVAVALWALAKRWTDE